MHRSKFNVSLASRLFVLAALALGLCLGISQTASAATGNPYVDRFIVLTSPSMGEDVAAFCGGTGEVEWIARLNPRSGVKRVGVPSNMTCTPGVLMQALPGQFFWVVNINPQRGWVLDPDRPNMASICFGSSLVTLTAHPGETPSETTQFGTRDCYQSGRA